MQTDCCNMMQYSFYISAITHLQSMLYHRTFDENTRVNSLTFSTKSFCRGVLNFLNGCPRIKYNAFHLSLCTNLPFTGRLQNGCLTVLRTMECSAMYIISRIWKYEISWVHGAAIWHVLWERNGTKMPHGKRVNVFIGQLKSIKKAHTIFA